MQTVKLDAKGYGYIDKAVIRNKNLNTTDIAVYSVLCSYRNYETGEATPSYDILCHNAKVCRSTLRKTLKKLEKEQIITREYIQWKGHIYKIDRAPENGYGKMPKLIQYDNRINSTALAVYAHIASYAGRNNYAYPRVRTICRELGICLNTYNKAMNLLIECEYIVKNQSRKEGKFSVNYYYLPQEITLPKNYTENPKAIILKKIQNISKELGAHTLDISVFARRINKLYQKAKKHIVSLDLYIKVMIRQAMIKSNMPLSRNSFSTEKEWIEYSRNRLRQEIEAYYAKNSKTT